MAGGSYPRIRTGLGELTPMLWDRLMTALEFVETQRGTIERIGPRSAGSAPASSPGVVLLQIGGAIPFLGNPTRWRYQWAQATVDDGDFIPVADGLTNASEGYGLAFNAEEAENSSAAAGTTSYGVPNTPGIGQTVAPLRIPSGSIVLATFVSDATAGTIVPVFGGTNALLIGCGP